MTFFRRYRLGAVLTSLAVVPIMACQQTPFPSSPVAEAPQESPSPEAALPVEIAKLPEKEPEFAPKVAKAAIPRLLPESILAAPQGDLASARLQYNTVLSTRTGHTAQKSSWQYRHTRDGTIFGFELSNHGGNRVLPPRRDATKNQFFTRDFQFRFDERARQDIQLLVTDWVASRDRQFRLSETMNSQIHFFPRSFLPAIVNSNGRTIVTLPTGEEVEFDAHTNEIIAGVLSEGPVDLNPDGDKRSYPAISYSGTGVIVRANARGSDPRLGTTATIITAEPITGCDKETPCNHCQVPSRELWEQSGAVRFKFATDRDFDRYLVARCQFGLPKSATAQPR
jgi:hypothetical protein